MKKRLLIYYPPNNKAIILNTVVGLLTQLDIEIFVLTQSPYGQVHKDLEAKLPKGNIKALEISNQRGIFFYLKHTKELIQFCRKNRIDVVFSHLQIGNLVAIISSFFLPKIRFIFFRHHFHYNKKYKIDGLRNTRNELIGEKIVNIFAKKVVAVSNSVKEEVIKYEKVNPTRIKVIPHIYNFTEYPSINYANVQCIREKYKAELLLLMSSRFVEPKRHQLVINVLHQLIRQKQMDIKMLLLDNGPLMDKVSQQVLDLGMQNHVFFIGYTNSFVDYMAASDLLVNPSLSEASNSSVKEIAALTKKTAVVCAGVGDFDDYIIHNQNGFLIDPTNSEQELKSVIEFAYFHKSRLDKMGASLKETVLEKFSPNEKVLELYKSLLS